MSSPRVFTLYSSSGRGGGPPMFFRSGCTVRCDKRTKSVSCQADIERCIPNECRRQKRPSVPRRGAHENARFVAKLEDFSGI